MHLRPWLLALATSSAVAFAPAPSHALPQNASPAPTAIAAPPSLPVRDVTVYSDRARVVRAGSLNVAAGTQRVNLGALTPRLDPDSVRLQVTGAKLARVEVRRAERQELPRTEVERLIRELESARDAATTLSDRRSAYERELQLMRSLRPTSSPQADGDAPPVRFEPGGWRAAVTFFAGRDAAATEAIRKIDEDSRQLRKRIEQLAAQASQLAAGTQGEPGYEVEAVLEGGGGPAKLELTYMALGARWMPAYDVRFNPGAAQVEVAFAGLVSQETGEDWPEARLTLSTAVPATTATLPKLLAWKIGDRDQFIPTPVPKPTPPPPPPPRARRDSDEQGSDELLRARLLAVAREDRGPVAPPPMMEMEESRAYQSAPPPPPSRPMPAPQRLERSKRKSRAPAAAPAMPSVEVPAPAPMMERESVEVSAGAAKSMAYRPPSVGLSFGAPLGYRPPSYSWELPASLAGGYDFTYTASRPERVRSGGEARRVALHVAKFPAKPLVTILPALSKQAYLIAEVTNSSERPLLRGQANLYVGADLQGQAVIDTTAMGQKLTLPLGIDDGIQVVRNTKLLSAEKGFISKDGVNTYEVTLELLNPRGATLDARVIDQIPLKGDKHVEIKLDKMEPWAIHDEHEGTLEWHVQLAAKQKKVITFQYTLTYPKGAKLRQW